MILRPYRHEDFSEVTRLFYETVHTVNARDYNSSQLEAWAPEVNDYGNLRQALEETRSLVVEEDGVSIGFGDIDETGYIDHLFVHKDHQGRHVATMLCDELECGHDHLSVHASITARPFFEKRGYHVVKRQEVPIRGQVLINYVMEKP